MALLSIRDVSVGFGGALVLENISLQIERGERLGLVGRNGVGKSTLLKIIVGELEPDAGMVIRERGLQVAYLVQEVPEGLTGSVADILAGGLGASEASPPPNGDEDAWRRRLQMDTIIARMGLDPAADFERLSAGLKRRILLARGLVRDPDIVLLDEPTNHLDIDAIAWLEDYLLRYGGTLVFVTHDRVFLRKLATRIIEIDRGRLIDWACDYDTFTARKEAILAVETTQAAEFDKKLAQEEVWIRQGIEARRTRNEGRVRALEQLRRQRRDRREQPGALRMQIQEAERSGRLVMRAEGVSFSYGGQPVVRDFSTTIMRGDKVGIVGPNGSGKTTLLRLLLGELPPQAGTLRHGTNLEIAYFDQLRAQLEEDRTVMDNVADGRDFVTVNGRRRHVIGYLQDFLFTSERAPGLRRHPVGRRAQPAAAGAPLCATRQPAGDGRADERSGSGNAGAAGRSACWNTRARCCWSATTGSCSTTSSPAPWRSKVTAASASMLGVTTTGCASVLPRWMASRPLRSRNRDRGPTPNGLALLNVRGV